MDKDRDKIIEKRSSLRSWRERAQRRPRQSELLGIALVAVIFLAVMASAFMGNGSQASEPGKSVAPTEEKPTAKETPSPTTAPSQQTPLTPTLASIPAPSIRIDSPKNATYDTSTPPISFIVAGSGLDTVLLSVDGGRNITVPHDGTLAKIDFAKGNPLFIEDFSGGAKRWKESGNWRVEDGKYITTDGTSSFGESEWGDYTLEVKQRMVSGRASAVGIRWDGEKNKYYIQTHDTYTNLVLVKFDKNGYTSLTATKLSDIGQNDWHIWKIVANGSKIQAFIDGIQYIEYEDNSPYLEGNAQLASWSSTTVEYDYVSVYKPLSDGLHRLTIFANNTAGNASSKTIFFTINAAEANTQEKKTGSIKETISKDDFEITLKRFDVYKVITVYPSVYKRSEYAEAKMVSALTLTVKNTGNKEKPFKLEPKAVILDDEGNQYEMQVYKYMKNENKIDDQIKQTPIYPGVKREGVIYFEPNVKLTAKKVRLFLYVNGMRYDFTFDPYM